MLREFKASRPALDRTRECSFFVPEQFAFHQRFGHSRAVDGNKGTISAPAQVMNGARNQFFAGAAFTGNQHRGFAGSDLPDQ